VEKINPSYGDDIEQQLLLTAYCWMTLATASVINAFLAMFKAFLDDL